MRRLAVLILFVALTAQAQEHEAKRRASQPGALKIFPMSNGLSTGLTVPADRLPKVWLSQLTRIKGAHERVLVPNDVPVHAQLVTGPTWYSLSWREGSRYVVLMVRYAGHVLPGFDTHALDPQRMVIARTHGIVSIDSTFEGAAVTFDVECQEPAKDPACARDELVRERVMNLAVVQ